MVLSDAQLARTQKTGRRAVVVVVQRCLIGLAFGWTRAGGWLCSANSARTFPLAGPVGSVHLCLLLGWWIWPGGRSSFLPLDDRSVMSSESLVEEGGEEGP